MPDILAIIILLGGSSMFLLSLLYARAVIAYRREMRVLVVRLEQSMLSSEQEALEAASQRSSRVSSTSAHPHLT